MGRIFRLATLLFFCTLAALPVYGQGNEAKTDAYNKLKAMAEEDWQLRMILDKVADSLNLANISRKIAHTDSLHFDYLHNYVKKYGWPTADNGAAYAIKLAAHDHEHYADYATALKNAVQKGTGTNEDLELINDLANTEQNYSYFQKMLVAYKGKYMRFDVSSMLQNKLPASQDRIQKVVKQHCPVKMYYAISCRYERTANLWEEQNGVSFGHAARKDILTRLNKEIGDYCPKGFYDGCCWMINYVPAEHKYTKLTLYVIWDWKDHFGDQ